MSAYVVDRKHILYLVQAGAAWRSPFDLAWIWGVNQEKSTYKRGTLRKLDVEEAVRTAQMLWDENIHSVAYRYPDSDLPGPINEDYTITKHDFAHTVFDSFDPVQVLKSCDCYEYQSCEHPAWGTSEAKAFVQALRKRAISHLPGYEEAVWGAPTPASEARSLMR